MIGTVVSIKYGVYSINVGGVIYNTSPTGILKFKEKIYVGDEVFINDENYVIEQVLKRKSFLKRPAISNIDQILLVFSLSEPAFSYYLALKYVTYANYNHVPCKIIITKNDLGDNKTAEEIKNVFNKLNIDVFFTSKNDANSVLQVKELLKDKISVLIGQSGVGKSTLLNNIDPEFARDVGEYSFALGRGKHKTKEIILLPYENGYIADTPGFSSLELDLSVLEVAHYYPGFEKLYTNCFYSNCLHKNEKNCAALEKVKEGNIPSIVYENYLKLLKEVEEYR